jgi:hypothetical protein
MTALGCGTWLIAAGFGAFGISIIVGDAFLLATAFITGRSAQGRQLRAQIDPFTAPNAEPVDPN